MTMMTLLKSQMAKNGFKEAPSKHIIKKGVLALHTLVVGDYETTIAHTPALHLNK